MTDPGRVNVAVTLKKSEGYHLTSKRKIGYVYLNMLNKIITVLMSLNSKQLKSPLVDPDP